MNKKVLLEFIPLVIFLIFGLCGRVLAQIPVRTGPASAQEIQKARTALRAKPDSLETNRNYIFAMGISNPVVVAQYRAWMKKYPKNVNIPLAAGTVYHNAEMPQAKEFLLRAAAMQPKNAKIWSMLSDDAFTRGEKTLSTEYLRKAMLADTSNAVYASAYLMSFQNNDPGYKQKVFEFVKRFPTDEHGAQALYWLSKDATNLDDKINDFEELRKLYPPQKFRWSSYGMEELANIYLQTDPEKALALINQMGDGNDWNTRKQVAESFIQISELERDQNYKEAAIELNRVKLPGYIQINDFIVLKKASLLEKTGDVKAAYDSVAVKFAKLPSDQLYNTLQLYGAKIRKGKEQIDKEIEKIRNSTAVTAYPFELGLYTSNGKLNLTDLKGKVVLLTFWFPACSPCRAEFPHFEAVINKFKGENVAYVGIDVSPLQDPYVIPLMKESKYSFIPLRGTSAFANKYYGVQGEPENFLIDREGKIIFRDFRIDNTNHRTLELMISSLLKKGPQNH